jgi:hypothetical protein
LAALLVRKPPLDGLGPEVHRAPEPQVGDLVAAHQPVVVIDRQRQQLGHLGGP